MLNLILPALLLMFLQLFAFYLPPDSSDKISFGLTILLSFVVFIIVVSENIPTTSKSVPLIGKLVLACYTTTDCQPGMAGQLTDWLAGLTGQPKIRNLLRKGLIIKSSNS